VRQDRDLVVEHPETEPPGIRFDLQGPVRPRWTLIKRLQLTLEFEDDDSLILSDDVFLIYGVGDTFKEALSDYLTNLEIYFDLVSSDVATGVQEAQAMLDHLQEYIHLLP
jgi:hypothetical protein